MVISINLLDNINDNNRNYTMKTIKELEAIKEKHLSYGFIKKYTFVKSQIKTLKEVLELIDELDKEGYNREAIIRILKARIEG